MTFETSTSKLESAIENYSFQRSLKRGQSYDTKLHKSRKAELSILWPTVGTLASLLGIVYLMF